MKAEKEKAHYHGHRARLKDKFKTQSSESFYDYELLELLLFYIYPRIDVKPLAKELWQLSGNNWHNLIHLTKSKLDKLSMKTDNLHLFLTLLNEISSRLTKESLIDTPILSNFDKVMSYCESRLSRLEEEQLRCLFLNQKNHLLADDLIHMGTIDQTPFYPREIIKKCFEHNATAMILVHNHPSGDPTPSKQDIEMTKAFIDVCKPLNLSVHDHIIVTKNKTVSLKRLRCL